MARRRSRQRRAGLKEEEGKKLTRDQARSDGTQAVFEALEDTPSIDTDDAESDEEADASVVGNFEDLKEDVSAAADHSRSMYEPESFTPLPRSLLTGVRSRQGTPKRKLGANIILDDTPDRLQSPGAGPSREKRRTSHFQPPALFSTTMMPEVVTQNGEIKVELARPEGVDGSEGGLLLPAHVVMGGEVEEGEASPPRDLDGVHFLDDDTSRGVTRYFDPDVDDMDEEATFLATADQSKLCTKCKRPGHNRRDCPHIMCTICGIEDDHERKDCPMGVVCFNCGQRGHRVETCTEPRVDNRRGCALCGNQNHRRAGCPMIWRIYSYMSKAAREEKLRQKAAAQGWAKEAIGGPAYEEWCYNCAREGHFGDDCPERRGSLAKLLAPSAFSREMAQRGPYRFANLGRPQNSLSRSTATPTHYLFSDDEESSPLMLPNESTNRPPSAPGKKTKEKAKRRLQELEAGEIGSEEEDFFANGSALRRSGSHLGNGRFPNQASRGGKLRPWDSEKRGGPSEKNGRTPFSHKDFMSKSTPNSAPRMVFGKISGRDFESPVPQRPGSALGRRTEGGQKDTPVQRFKQQNGFRPPSPAGSTSSQGSGRNRGKRQREDQGRDWEVEWRSKGNGGGPVTGWGKDFDREERAGKSQKTSARAPNGGGKSTPKSNGKPVASGQKYRGGY